MPTPLRLQYADLLSAARARKTTAIIGRDAELRMLARMLSRRERNSVLISGPPGVGKSALIHGLAQRIAQADRAVPSLPMLRLDTRQLATLLRQPSHGVLDRVRRALSSLPPAIVVIDDLEQAIGDLLGRPAQLDDLFRPFVERPGVRLLGVLSPDAERILQGVLPYLQKHVEPLHLAEPPTHEILRILARACARLSRAYRVECSGGLAEPALELARHLPARRALPDRALQLLDEACAHCRVRGLAAVRVDELRAIVAEQSGMPLPPSGEAARTELAALDKRLQAAVIGQAHAVSLVADIVRRGWLGLRNPSRPIGSFLFLGPSGVGKTECAKVLAREVYGRESAFHRIDLSEYQEAHTVQRLLGAPPGYIGHDAGGQLTNPVQTRPFSLILLDELEKADPSVLDVFLQLLDDGRLTDGRGQTVDFTKTIVIATSNLAHREILAATARAQDVTAPAFLSTVIRPVLFRHLRPEFVNRFDAVIVFRPLSVEALTSIAELELRKIAARLQHHHLTFRASRALLTAKARELADPAFGARPLKRFLEATCERAVARHLLG